MDYFSWFLSSLSRLSFVGHGQSSLNKFSICTALILLDMASKASISDGELSKYLHYIQQGHIPSVFHNLNPLFE